MGKFTVAYSIATILCFNVFSFSQHTKIPLSDVDSNLRAKVYAYAFNIFTAKSVNELPELSTKDFSTYVIEEYSKISYDFIHNDPYKTKYGVLKSLKLVEVLEGGKQEKIFRYKTRYSKANSDSEIRFVINKDDKIIGFIRQHFWSDDILKIPLELDRVTKDKLEELVLKKHKLLAFKTYNNCMKEDMFIHTTSNTTQASLDADMMALNLKECDSIKQKHGDFKNLKFVELLKDDYFSRIYRFKVNFDNLEQVSEIRIYCDSEDKYRGIFVVDYWFDKYYELNTDYKLDMTDEN